MKNNGLTITLIVLLTIVVVILTVFLVFALKGSQNNHFFHFGFGGVSNNLVVDETYENIFDTIKIEGDAGDIEVLESTDDMVKVTIYGDEENTFVDTLGSELKIKSTAKKCIGICFNVKTAKIQVVVPKNYAGKIDIKNKYGDTEIGYFENAEITLENNYGDIDVDRAKTLDIHEDCGDVKVKEVERIVVKNNYGDIKISRVNGFMDIKNSCGNIKVEKANILENSYVEDNMGDIKINEINEVYIDAKTSLGDVKVNNVNRNAEIVLKIKNDCGDIRVDN